MDKTLDKNQSDFKSRLVNKFNNFAIKNKETKNVEFFNIADFSEIKYRKVDDKVLMYHSCYDKV